MIPYFDRLLLGCAVSFVIFLLYIRFFASRNLLLGLAYSHYVEIARWALDKNTKNDEKESSYTELRLPVGPHVYVVAMYRLLFAGGLSSSSSFPGSQLGKQKQRMMFHPTMRKLSGVPAFVTSDGKLLPDSWSILAYCGYEIDEDTMVEFDQLLGPAVRQFGYYHVFQVPKLYRQIQSSPGTLLMFFFDFFERTLRVSSTIMPRMMEIEGDGAANAEKTIREVFANVSSILRDRPFLGRGKGSETMGGADLAFAALSGWALLPLPNFHNGKCDLPSITDMGPDVQRLTTDLRKTPAGKHAIMLYEKMRL